MTIGRQLRAASFGLAAVAVVVVGFPAAGHCRAGVVAAWSFDNNFNVTDGNPAFNLTPQNGASISTAQARFGGGSAEFQRVSSQYATTTGTLIATGESFSYSAWYYLNEASISGSSRYFVMESQADPATTGGNFVPVSFGLRDLGAGDIGQAYYFSAGGAGDEALSFPTAIQSWRNVIVTFDAPSKTLTAYYDGVLQSSLTSTVADLPTVVGLVVGGHRDGTGRNWNGWIDEVAVWDTALTQAEVTYFQSHAVPEPGTLAGVATSLCMGAYFGWRRRLGGRSAA